MANFIDTALLDRLVESKTSPGLKAAEQFVSSATETLTKAMAERKELDAKINGVIGAQLIKKINDGEVNIVEANLPESPLVTGPGAQAPRIDHPLAVEPGPGQPIEMKERPLRQGEWEKLLRDAFSGKEMDPELKSRLRFSAPKKKEEKSPSDEVTITKSMSKILKAAGKNIEPGEVWRTSLINTMLEGNRPASTAWANLAFRRERAEKSDKNREKDKKDEAIKLARDRAWPYTKGRPTKTDTLNTDTPEKWGIVVQSLKDSDYTQEDFPAEWRKAGIVDNITEQEQEALKWMKANPDDPRVPAMLKKMGLTKAALIKKEN